MSPRASRRSVGRKVVNAVRGPDPITVVNESSAPGAPDRVLGRGRDLELRAPSTCRHPGRQAEIRDARRLPHQLELELRLHHALLRGEPRRRPRRPLERRHGHRGTPEPASSTCRSCRCDRRLRQWVPHEAPGDLVGSASKADEAGTRLLPRDRSTSQSASVISVVAPERGRTRMRAPRRCTTTARGTRGRRARSRGARRSRRSPTIPCSAIRPLELVDPGLDLRRRR